MKVSFSKIGINQPNVASKINFRFAIIALLLTLSFYTISQIQTIQEEQSQSLLDKVIDFYNQNEISTNTYSFKIKNQYL